MATLALIGGAHIHTPGFIKAIKKRDNLKVKSVWDHDAARAKSRADDLGAAVLGDINEICKDKEIDAVIICSETHRHRELVAAAASAKKDLFAEKPLGLGAEDAHAMAEEIEKAGVKFQTGYFMRGQPMNQFVKQKIDDGSFGKITRARVCVCHGGALGGLFDGEWRWMADLKQAGVGGFGDLGTHGLDLLMWWLGEVATCGAMIDNGTKRYPDCDELGEGVIRFNSGAIGTLAGSWDDVANPVMTQICGTEGHLLICNGKLYFQSKKSEGSDIKKEWTDLPAAKNAGFEAFLDAVEGKDADLVKPREAAARSAVMAAMYESAKRQPWLKPS